MGAWWSSLFSKEKRAPIKGPLPRLKNVLINNFRGILGVLIPIIFLSWQMEKGKAMAQVMWILMFWFFLLQPIAVPTTAMIPIFFMPMTGLVSTADTCRCYFNDNIALFIISSMLILLLNNSGFDRRLALFFLCSGDACQFAGKRLIFKCSVAAFFLSMFSNRLIVTSIIIQYVTPIFINLKSATGKSTTEPCYDEIRYIINNAIQTSSAIGSIAIMHSAYATLAFRAIWCESAAVTGDEYPDIFNYLQYSLFAFPVACVMFVLNFSYHMLLLNFVVGKPMSAASMNQVRNEMMKYKDAIPKNVTSHEKITVLFTIVSLLVLFLRWNKYSNMGWADYNKVENAEHSPVVKDVTVCALFVCALHILPRTLNFTQFLRIEKKSELKNVKPESSILFWRFVDRNTNYGYFFVFGAGLALELAIRKSGLASELTTHLGKNITGLEWAAGLFVVCLIASILPNIMTGVAGLVCFLPFVLNMSREGAAVPWPKKTYLPAVGVGIASSLGFMWPFLYTPAYFCHYTGKVPMIKMAKYSIISVLICCIVLWLSLCFWGPYLWDSADGGFVAKAAATVGGAVAPPPAADGGDAGGDAGGGDAGGGGGDDAGGGEGGDAGFKF